MSFTHKTDRETKNTTQQSRVSIGISMPEPTKSTTEEYEEEEEEEEDEPETKSVKSDSEEKQTQNSDSDEGDDREVEEEEEEINNEEEDFGEESKNSGRVCQSHTLTARRVDGIDAFTLQNVYPVPTFLDFKHASEALGETKTPPKTVLECLYNAEPPVHIPPPHKMLRPDNLVSISIICEVSLPLNDLATDSELNKSPIMIPISEQDIIKQIEAQYQQNENNNNNNNNNTKKRHHHNRNQNNNNTCHVVPYMIDVVNVTNGLKTPVVCQLQCPAFKTFQTSNHIYSATAAANGNKNQQQNRNRKTVNWFRTTHSYNMLDLSRRREHTSSSSSSSSKTIQGVFVPCASNPNNNNNNNSNNGRECVYLMPEDKMKNKEFREWIGCDIATELNNLDQNCTSSDDYDCYEVPLGSISSAMYGVLYNSQVVCAPKLPKECVVMDTTKGPCLKIAKKNVYEMYENLTNSLNPELHVMPITSNMFMRVEPPAKTWAEALRPHMDPIDNMTPNFYKQQPVHFSIHLLAHVFVVKM